MQTEIITIGDELLIGQVIDTNSAWMGQQLNLSGIHVKQITSVSDDKQHIIDTLNTATLRADIILITGGLGPTKDDITKQTLCEFFNSDLIFNENIYKNVERLFKSRGLEVTKLNKQQAMVPDNCIAIQNSAGTAPGMWFEKGNKIYVSMPGVPYEMKSMMVDSIIPMLKKKYQLPAILHKTVLTQGMGESFLSELIGQWETSLENESIKLAYLPSPGIVRLRLSATGTDAQLLNKKVDEKIEELKKIIPKYIYGFEIYGEGQETLQEITGKLLKEKKKTLCIAESCTGGYIAHLITSIAGSSEYFCGSITPYLNRIKTEILKVNEHDILKYGAVSKEVVEQMISGALQLFGADYAIAVSGIAGPAGGTKEKPVGTVWIGIGNKEKKVVEKYLFGENRERTIHKTAITALNMLRKELIPIRHI